MSQCESLWLCMIDASERLCRTDGPANEIHPHRPGAQRGSGMSSDHLDHAEGRSKQMDPPQAEAQPRGAVVRGRRRIDHAEAAERFLAAPKHQAFHDERLWVCRTSISLLAI